MHDPYDIRSIGGHFRLHGNYLEASPYGSGHINDTYAAVYNQAGTRVRYIVQRINHHVFKQPENVMGNIRRVTEHLGLAYADDPRGSQHTLSLVLTHEGEAFHRDDAGNVWRVYLFIEGARTCDVVESPAQAFQVARAFGLFQKRLTDLPGPRLHETIRDFHHTPARFAALEKAVAADAHNRARLAKPEIDFALRHRDLVGVLTGLQTRGLIPERITHNDTKLNNVMLDDATGEGICVIDLDTVMPGLALYDFGDMVRTTTSPALEDERDLSKVTMQMPMFEALAQGYVSTAGEFLTPVERDYLAFSGKLITFEIGIRFLTDFLAGDAYFKVHREGHNLDRCRTQFALVASIGTQEDQMNRLVAGL
jgi:hypothetical protein